MPALVDPLRSVIDPLKFQKANWPGVTFYKEQLEIIYSVVDNRETVVVAGNQLGKDFVAAFIILWFFISRRPCRIVTTSAKDDHLRVLWGEIGNWVSQSKCKLDYDPKHGYHSGLVINQREITRVIRDEVEKISYVRGMVASPDKVAAMQGHHATPFSGTTEARLNLPLTLFVCDEASGVPHGYYDKIDTWAKRLLIFGNPWPCDNFFRYAVKGNPKTSDPGGDLSWA